MNRRGGFLGVFFLAATEVRRHRPRYSEKTRRRLAHGGTNTGSSDLRGWRVKFTALSCLELGVHRENFMAVSLSSAVVRKRFAFAASSCSRMFPSLTLRRAMSARWSDPALDPHGPAPAARGATLPENVSEIEWSETRS